MGSNWEPLSEIIKHVRLKENHAILYPRLEALARGGQYALNIKDYDCADEIRKSFYKTVDLGGGSE